MTSQYVTEPPTSGLVQLVTSKGTLDIELWPRECPLACRNFLTLALEGFYDNLIFHRLIPSFIIQSGDPTGTGSHGESSFGSPFPIEPHSRLKFNRRGLLAMAAGEERTNESQFFLTLDATPELQGKHTLFGRVVGKSIYSLVELSEVGEMKGERPRYPPKLVEVRVVENPFPDLKPRMTKDERREMERREKEERKRRREEEERREREKEARKSKKKKGLLSFGAHEGEEEGEEVVLKGPKSSHDLLKDDKRLSKQAIQVQKESKASGANGSSGKDSVEAGPSKQPPRAEPVDARKPANDKHPDPPKSASRSSSSLSGRDLLSAHRAKYTSSSSSSSKSDSLSALLSFQSRLRSSTTRSTSKSKDPQPDEEGEEEEEEAREYGSSDDDTDWRAHRLDAGGKPLNAGADGKDKLDDYEVLDPRQHRTNGKAREKDDQRSGKRRRDWVDDTRRYSSYHDRGKHSDRHRDRDRDRASRHGGEARLRDESHRRRHRRH